MKYTIKDFNKQYPNDDACLETIFRNRYGKSIKCTCGKQAKYYRVRNRKCYACEYCGHQLHPLADTIFHKSSTSLRDWFYAIFLFANSKNGVSAKELQRQLGTTYKCSWRMAKQIRLLFSKPNSKLSNTIEVDETYIGGKAKDKRGRGAENKTPVVGMVERKGNITAQTTKDTTRSTLSYLISKNITAGSSIITDEYKSYKKVSMLGYKHGTINHAKKQYVKGQLHTNTIEGFWSQLKRSINGTYHAVSPKYLQTYVNELAYRYNQRNASEPLFSLLISKVVKRV
jgi:transposase-like protein